MLKKVIIPALITICCYVSVYGDRHIDPTWSISPSLNKEGAVALLLSASARSDIEKISNLDITKDAEKFTSQIAALHQQAKNINEKMAEINTEDYVEGSLPPLPDIDSATSKMRDIQVKAAGIVNDTLGSGTVTADTVFTTEVKTVFPSTDYPLLAVDEQPHTATNASLVTYLDSIPANKQAEQIKTEITQMYTDYQKARLVAKSQKAMYQAALEERANLRKKQTEKVKQEMTSLQMQRTQILAITENLKTPYTKRFNEAMQILDTHVIDSVDVVDEQISFDKAGAFLVIVATDGVYVASNNIFRPSLKITQNDLLITR